MPSNLIAAAAIGYVVLLFGVAFLADRRAAVGRVGWLTSPLVYTLSISVYCTAWTFYGAVGSAARNGLEFMTIYTGPTLVFLAWWVLLRKLVRIGRTQHITSIADLISSRYGKSPTLAIAVTLLAVTAATPYIALQLQSLTLSYAALAEDDPAGQDATSIGLAIAAGLALFTILFGTRHVDANERHHGVVTAIALEAVVKLVALLAVGIFAVWGVAAGPADVFARMDPALLAREDMFGARWVTLTFLAGAAILCLPRMFQVTVVENVDERHLATASWAFPSYLFLVCLFVLPIAIIGRATLPEGANPDLFVLTIPLAHGQEALALFAFLGGFSAATSMVIVATIALATMVSNHIIMPIWLGLRGVETRAQGDVRAILIASRRLAIVGILGLGYLYYRIAGGAALAAIGLIAFAGVAQILPALLAGIYWRGATRAGALAAVTAGFLLWTWCLFLPSFHGGVLVSEATLAEGPWGIAALRPQALLGLEGLDPLVHAVFWSMSANVLLLVGVSLATRPEPLERLQAALFVDAFRVQRTAPRAFLRRSAASADLLGLAGRILGEAEAGRLFAALAREQGRAPGLLPEPTDGFVERVERALAGAVGAASAHAMVNQIAGGQTISIEALMSIADETARILDYSHRLEVKSRELEATAAELRRANTQLRELSEQKDAFLSQVSHELRTPMTSIRSFAEILRGSPDLAPEQRERFLSIIHEESQRLSRLLDEILDLSFLEAGRTDWVLGTVDLEAAIDQAVAATEAIVQRAGIRLDRAPRRTGFTVEASQDRLAQVFINLISNAVKYAGPGVTLSIVTSESDGQRHVDVADSGPGVPEADRARIFEKFARARGLTDSRGAGLGLPISREIMKNLGGELRLLPSAAGAVFRVSLPVPARAERPARTPALADEAGGP